MIETHSKISQFQEGIKCLRFWCLDLLTYLMSLSDRCLFPFSRMTPHSVHSSSPAAMREDGLGRGFQPYRPGDDLRHQLPPTAFGLDPATAAAYSAAYPAAFLPPHPFPHPAFRYVHQKINVSNQLSGIYKIFNKYECKQKTRNVRSKWMTSSSYCITQHLFSRTLISWLKLCKLISIYVSCI